MSFLSFALKNPFRNKLRSLFVIFLLILGILSIGGIVTFSELSSQIMESSLDPGGLDITITQNGYLNITDLNKLKSIDGVQNAVGISNYNVQYDSRGGILAGFAGKEFINNTNIEGIGKIKLISGTLFTDNPKEIILTKNVADQDNKKVGDIVNITRIDSTGTDGSSSGSQASSHSSTELTPNISPDQREFKIVSIINDLPNNIEGILPIQTVNKIVNNTSKLRFDYIAVKTKEGQLENVKTTLNQSYPNYITYTNKEFVDEFKKILLYISLFFIGIGTIIMMFSTLKSVSERTREIGVLKAIGWSNKRVMSLILIESLIQFILAWIITLIFVIVIILGVELPAAKYQPTVVLNFLYDNTSLVLYALGLSFSLSLLMPLIGCLIPLLRVARLKPTEALKYE